MSDNTETKIYDKTDEVIKELLKSLLLKYQIRLETSMKDSDFIFDCIHLLYYKCHKSNLNHGGLYIDFPDWIKNKKAKINSTNDDENDFNPM